MYDLDQGTANGYLDDRSYLTNNHGYNKKLQKLFNFVHKIETLAKLSTKHHVNIYIHKFKS